MHRPAPGHCVTVTTAGGPFQAFVPALLPPEPPVVWSAPLRRRFDAALAALGHVQSDPRMACFYARHALELAVGWAYKHDTSLKLRYQDNLSVLGHEPSFKQAAGEAVFSVALRAGSKPSGNLTLQLRSRAP